MSKLKIMRNFLCLILAMLLILQIPVEAMAAGLMNEANDVSDNDLTITPNVAGAIALLFVAGNISENVDENLETTVADGESDHEIMWNEDVNISSIIPLYETENTISAYCVKLQSGNEYAGYIVVSTNLNVPLIQEVSTDSLPLFETITSAEGKNYYYGSLQYSKEAVEESNNSALLNDDNNDVNDQQTVYESNSNMVAELSNDKYFGNGIQNNTAITYGAISSMTTYLKNEYPSYVFSLTGSKLVTGYSTLLPAYTISGTNACAMYGFASILTYHLKNKDSISLSSRVTKVKELAVDNGYATTSNYYLANSKYKAFGDLCINYYNASLSTTNSVFTWNTGKSEINNSRPILLNISTANSGYYKDHTVVAYGWYTYTSTYYVANFFAVRDGYSTGTRYVLASGMGPSYITCIRPN